MPFSPEQLDQLAARGIPVEEARRQLGLLRRPPAPAALRRPCTPGDGLRRIDTTEQARLAEVWRAASDERRDERRVQKFVPASGAATRMFQSLHALRTRRTPETLDELRTTAESGDADARLTVSLLNEIEHTALCEPLGRALGRPAREVLAKGDYLALLDGMLGEVSGLGLGELPKGLIPFHLYPDGPDRSRTALEEHLIEGLGYLGSTAARRFHFTVSPDHLERFEAVARDAIRRLRGAGIEVAVDFSVQDPATDTLAIDGSGAPLADAGGRLVFRPAGHGALLTNLAGLEADLVFIKNIDNVVPEPIQGDTVAWKRVLAGLAIETQARVLAEFRQLEGADPDLERAWRFLDEHLPLEASADVREGSADEQRDYLADRLDRPLRVCGMVRNEGEPGGGPFWVAAESGEVAPQIVESAQVDLTSEAQAAIWNASTHFNPVDLVCCLERRGGRHFELADYCDPTASFVTAKSFEGRPITVLERPGLWNGSMAGWNTLFVEVPITTFAPVKTILDLLKPQHRPTGAT